MTFTKEQLQQIIDTDHVQCGDASALARMALAVMEAEPVFKVNHESSLIKHVKKVVRETSSPQPLTTSERAELENYRNAQVVPGSYVRDERGRMMLDGVCEPKIGFGTGWNACRSAMLQAGNSPALSPIDHGYRPDCECSGCIATARICEELAANPPVTPDTWIPVSERMPENDGAYLCWDNRYITTYAFIFGAWQANKFVAKNITHWMPLPAAPQQEVTSARVHPARNK